MDATFTPNSYYHVFNHAIGFENLYKKPDNYVYFLKKFAEYIEPVCGTYAFCLMPNHFHILVKVRSQEELFEFYRRKHTEQRHPVKLKLLDEHPERIDLHKLVMQEFQNFLNGYAKAFNRMYDRDGGLFLHYLNRKEIDSEAYLYKIVHYIHFNPVHHGFCKSIMDWDFSSIHAFVAGKKSKILRDEVLAWFDNEQAFWTFHQQVPDFALEKEMEFLE